MLLVEDNPLDARMFGRAAGRSGLAASVDAVATGEEALEALSDREAFDLVLLDINLPGIDGFEVLRRLDPDHPPVVMLSSSANQLDVTQAYDAGAAAYLTKPVGNEDYDRLLDAIGAFWSELVSYPD